MASILCASAAINYSVAHKRESSLERNDSSPRGNANRYFARCAATNSFLQRHMRLSIFISLNSKSLREWKRHPASLRSPFCKSPKMNCAVEPQPLPAGWRACRDESQLVAAEPKSAVALCQGQQC